MMIPSYFGGYGPVARFRQRNNAVDAKKYDFRALRTNLTHPNNVVVSIVHMLMSGLGSGLVVLHAAYSECGIWTALGVNVVLIAIVGYCVCILVWSAQKLYGRVQVATLTYPDTMEASVLLSPWPKFRKCARCFRYTLEILLLIHLYGSCCVCVIMIGRNLKELVEGDDTIGDAGDPPLKVYILSLMLPCLVISMVTNLKVLAPFAIMCNLYALALVATTMRFGFRTTRTPWDRPAFKSTMGVFQFIGVCGFVLESVSYALPIENNMDNPKKFHYVVLGTMLIFAFTMVPIGFIGYWRYGERCLSPLTVHFPYYPFSIIVKVCLCLILYIVYSLSFYVGFDIEWFYFKRHHAVSNYWFWERLYRIFHVVAIIMVSYYIPNVTRIMGTIGAFCTGPVMFLFPPFIELLVDWEYPGLGRFKWRLIKYIALLVFGLTTFFGGTFFNSYGLYLETFVYSQNSSSRS